jgi:hypothetical protein
MIFVTRTGAVLEPDRGEQRRKGLQRADRQVHRRPGEAV